MHDHLAHPSHLCHPVSRKLSDIFCQLGQLSAGTTVRRSGRQISERMLPGLLNHSCPVSCFFSEKLATKVELQLQLGEKL